MVALTPFLAATATRVENQTHKTPRDFFKKGHDCRLWLTRNHFPMMKRKEKKEKKKRSLSCHERSMELRRFRFRERLKRFAQVERIWIKKAKGTKWRLKSKEIERWSSGKKSVLLKILISKTYVIWGFTYYNCEKGRIRDWRLVQGRLNNSCQSLEGCEGFLFFFYFLFNTRVWDVFFFFLFICFIYYLYLLIN